MTAGLLAKTELRIRRRRSRRLARIRHDMSMAGPGSWWSAAGLELATGLGNGLGRRGRAEIALVECTRMHLWKPLFHEVAAGSLDVGEYELSYLAQAHWHNFR